MISIKEHNPELLNEWDYEKNAKLGKTPENTSYGSANKVWWKCPKGHSYLQGPNSKTSAKSGCSVCAGYQIIKGYNDFESKYPELMKEWNYDKNTIKPDEISYGSKKEVWWICEKGHEWKTPLNRRSTSQKLGCPYCSNQKLLKGYNDLETKFPELLNEWNYEKNDRKPSDYLYGSSQKVWWKCKDCGFEWRTGIIHRTGIHKTACPNCAPRLNRDGQLKKQILIEGSLYDNYPELMKEWMFDKNDKNPKDLVNKSSYRAWWKCSKCNYEWEAIVVSRTRENGTGCPVCESKIVVEGINDLKTLYPELVKEWNYEKNDKLKIYPNKVISHSEKKVWWNCPTCGNEYKAAITHRVNGTACPRCANELKTSFPEQAIYYYIKKEFPETVNRWNLLGNEVDIFIPNLNLGIEYDGSFYHNSKNALTREEDKYFNLSNKSIDLIRVREKDLEKESFANYIIKLEKRNNDKDLEKAIVKIFDYIELKYNYVRNLEIDIKKDRQEIYSQYLISRKENSLETLYPEIAKNWDYELNGNLKPYMVVPGSLKKVWWKCLKCDNSWESTIANHVKGAGCPYCAHQKVITGKNDLETLFPKIAKEWDYEKNDIKPSKVMPFSNKKFYWICSKGHSYLATPNSKCRKDSRGCPICSGHQILIGFNDIESQYPELMKEWDYKKNEKINLYPSKLTKGNNKKAWWKCKKGHEWEATIHARIRGTGCPTCYRNSLKNKYN